MMVEHDELSALCPGSCNRAYRRNTDAIEPVEGAPVWCRDCQTEIRDALRQLPRCAADAAAMPDGRLAPSGDTQGRTATQAHSPSGSPAWDLADDIIRFCLSWEDTLREHLRHERVRRTERAGIRDGSGTVVAVGPILRDTAARRTLAAAVNYLDSTFTPWMSWLDVAADAGAEMLAMATSGAKLTGRDRLVHRLPLPCLRCDRKALQRADGSELVKCAACRACWDRDDYDRLAHAYAESVPSREVAR